MRQLIYSKAPTASGKVNTSKSKQAFYREAKAHGMSCAEYRAALTAGTVTPVPSAPNRGWYGQPKSKVTPRIPINHIASLKPDYAKYGTACGKFQEVVRMVTDICFVTCSKCRTNYFAARAKVTPPPAAKVDDPRYTLKSPVHIRTKCGLMRDSVKALCGASGGCLTLSTVKPEYMESGYEGRRIRILVNRPQPNCPACFAKLEENKAKRRKAKVTHAPNLDAVKAMAAAIYPLLEEK
jgi:hypothetical protein